MKLNPNTKDTKFISRYLKRHKLPNLIPEEVNKTQIKQFN